MHGDRDTPIVDTLQKQFGGGNRQLGMAVSDNREDDFELKTGRFRADDGTFERGRPPKDYDPEANRYRANNGQFKDRSKDLLDEKAEAYTGFSFLLD